MSLNPAAIKAALVKSSSRALLVTKKVSPDILTGVGIAGAIGAAVLACRATLKVEPLLDEMNTKIDQAVQANANVPETYSDEGLKHDKVLLYAQTSIKVVELYAPAAILGAFSIGALLGAHGILKKRNAALAATVEVLNESFKKYRARVVEEFGQDKDREFILDKPTTTTVVNAKGEEQTVINAPTTVGASPYAKFFDEFSDQWSKDRERNLFFLNTQQNWFNDKLKAQGHLFLNEVYDALGLPRTPAGAIVGWIYDASDTEHGDNYVDFGIYDSNNERKRAFVNGYEPAILLDFNVDGVIYNLI